ncbi:iron-containing redox enzyme family protein [Conexibacter sp. JD483]|uniref:iron-containing redox enzyme family protein n=1 Tax=unclassified Conexibacter TaxID=2627773 RepID=UPI0027275ED9|nr:MULTISPECIES: iron-containing redox enzyme family protein [unclassified Conexibacter]MDO8185983.1 iron-containing redox enzyme family protein [Conexibacter sp. CPCC 205706]MDO8199474.1 iron-containing redox enzyme family protein [Conexibacter sp. CPCC 205762]MDR9368592.1 iron-containing redox enzyme family protein [Conexibacter sp. JD483]
MATTVTRPPGPREIALPTPRGPLSERLFNTLLEPPGTPLLRHAGELLVCSAQPLTDEDVQLALYVSYELHYSGIRGVDPGWEWDPALLAFRTQLEHPFEAAVCAAAGRGNGAVDPAQVGAALQELVAADEGPPLSRWIETRADREQMREFMTHRSAYQLKEADPHSWAIPRLSGAPKAALVEIQTDEYGGGDPARVHAVLFAKATAALGLDATYGAYLERLPAITLATVNLMSLCGLHRRLRGMIVGHLAAFEMTSSLPNRRYGNALRRLGFDADATDFFDEHVAADAVHENIAAWDLAGGLAAAEPHLAPEILTGARALLALEAQWARHLLGAWERDGSSLRPASP